MVYIGCQRYRLAKQNQTSRMGEPTNTTEGTDDNAAAGTGSTSSLPNNANQTENEAT